MINRFLNYQAVLKVVVYLRMSSDLQNPRSPDQQLETIQRKLREIGCRWQIVRVYRDDGISGRKIRGRPDFMRMVRDVSMPNSDISFILVDDLSRLGRSDEIQVIKSQLAAHQSIRVLSAMTNFADPFQLHGQVLDSMHQIIATQETKTKAHMVVRGKIDAIQCKHWPGGPIPFGLRLKSIFKEDRGRQILDYSVVVRNPETNFIIVIAFQRASETGWGECRLAQDLNADSRIPDRYKPITTGQLRSWLRNPIYKGDYRWNDVSTDYQDDRRVQAKNDAKDLIYIKGFCEASVAEELWNEVEELRRRRLEIYEKKMHARPVSELLDPARRIGRGVALRYLLSGLVICGTCKRAMQIMSCGGYRCRNGELKRYEAYYCPGSRAGTCDNRTTFSEPWLRQEVLSRLLLRLFPVSRLTA